MPKSSPGIGMLTDAAFVHAFESCALSSEAFQHQDHVRLAWLYLRQEEFSIALERMEKSIRRFAAHHHAVQKYHHTLTLAWMRLVRAALRESPGIRTLEVFFSRHPWLLDRDLPLTYYSRERMFSAAARAVWVEPDLRPLP